MKVPFQSCLVVETKVGHPQWSTHAESTACAAAVSAVALNDWMQRKRAKTRKFQRHDGKKAIKSVAMIYQGLNLR
jgi:hypothetical protein